MFYGNPVATFFSWIPPEVGSLVPQYFSRFTSYWRPLQRLLPFPALLFANQRDHHALNLQFAGRNEIWIARVFRFEIWPATLEDITFQCRFAVDQSRNNVAVMHVFGVFQNHNVPINNVRADH